MKKIRVPLIDKDIAIYVGEGEWGRWKKQLLKHGCEDPILAHEHDVVGEGGGLTWGSFVWLQQTENINTVFHEVQHALSAIKQHLRADDEEEFNAYIAGYVNEKVYNWLQEVNNVGEK